MRAAYYVVLSVMFWCTIWFIFVLALWLVLGCVVNPEKMVTYAVTVGSVAGTT